MSSSIAAINVAKTTLGLDEDTYRAKLANITGKSSLRAMSEGERQKVLMVFRSEGFKPKADRRANGRLKLSGRFAGKLQALWIAGWNLGIVDNRDDTALLSFVKRQTGIDHTRFLIYPVDARAAVEALKAWMKREAGVMFGNTNGQEWLARDGAKIAWAQWKLLFPNASLLQRQHFDGEAIRLTGRSGICWLGEMTNKDWMVVMNALGERVRAARRKVRNEPSL